MTDKKSDHQVLVQSILQGKLDRALSNQPYDYIETHISSVIVSTQFVYKLKKPLNLGFLDFSTLDKRHFYCDEELRLNQRLSPQLYMDVLAVYGSSAEPSFEASGEPIEYLLRMKPFVQTAQLDRLLKQGALNREMMIAFADYIADFHQSAKVVDRDHEYGNPDVIFQPMTENFKQIRGLLKSDKVIQQLDQLQQWTESIGAALHPTLLHRKADGFIRECHGDLHLRNLAWLDEQPLAFDCIEFDPALYWIDVISDLSFLWMDLTLNQRADLAWPLLNQYLSRSGDYAGLAVLDFYAVYRAMVRAKIAAISFDQSKEQQALQDVYAHLDLAQLFTETRSPVIYLMRGPSASGKSTLSQQLLAPLQAITLRSDIERKRLFGIEPQQNAADHPEQGIYSAEATQKTYQHLLELSSQILRNGYSVIIDATFSKPEQLRLFLDLASAAGYQCVILDLKVSESNLRQRIQQRQHDASDADISILQHQLQHWQPLSENESKYAVEIDLNKPLDLSAIVQLVTS